VKYLIKRAIIASALSATSNSSVTPIDLAKKRWLPLSYLGSTIKLKRRKRGMTERENRYCLSESRWGYKHYADNLCCPVCPKRFECITQAEPLIVKVDDILKIASKMVYNNYTTFKYSKKHLKIIRRVFANFGITSKGEVERAYKNMIYVTMDKVANESRR
jgi:hypothetical protein